VDRAISNGQSYPGLTSASGNCLVRSQQNRSAHHSCGDTFHSEQREERAPYDCADDGENDVQYETSAPSARPVNDLASDESSDKSEKGPCEQRHNCLWEALMKVQG
jgi:hypothetical protein